MRKIYKIMLGVMLLATVAGCKKDNEDPAPKYLDATYANVSGKWQLTSWNGIEQTATPYVYVILDRKEHTFDIYQNIESDKSQHVTGSFTIGLDENNKSVIKGLYDYSNGWWKHDYQVINVTATQMTWTATDADDVSIYTRVDAVPENIMNGTRALK